MKMGQEKIEFDPVLSELKALEKMSDRDIDFSDIPEVTNWEGAKRGMFYRPIKKLYSIRLDKDIVEWFKHDGSGYQTRINAALREYVKSKENV